MATRVFQEMPLDKWQWSPSPLPGQVVLVTSVNADGEVDIAPKSWVTMVSMGETPRMGFGCTMQHRTARNIQSTGVFAISVPDESLATTIWGLPDVRNRLSTGLTIVPAVTIGVPVIAECFSHIECRLDRIVELRGPEVFIIGAIQRIDMDAQAAAIADPVARYDAARPFFFLEDGLMAPLGPAKAVLPAGVGSHS